MSNRSTSHIAKITLMAVLVLHLFLALLATLETGLLVAQAARISFVAVCLTGLLQASIREWSLLTLALILAGVLHLSGNGTEPMNRALDLAAFFSAFIVLLTLIKTAAELSPSVEKVGHFLTSQPQGRRFFATAFGSHLLGVFLNFAAISLMSPLIQRSARHTDGSKDTQLEQRQISAMIRGFSWVIMWAPTTLTMAVIPSLFPQAGWIELLPYGLMAAGIMVVTGWIVDRSEWPRAVQTQRSEPPQFPRQSFGVLATVCFLFILLTIVVWSMTGLSIAKSLMFAAPVITLGWFAGLKMPGTGTANGGIMSFFPAFLRATPGFTASATTLGLSGLVGILAGEAVPIEVFAGWLNMSTIPSWLLLSVLPVLITMGGQAALSPILVVVFLGELLSSLPILPADPVHLMFALSAGWALSMTVSPNASATLLISSITRIPPTRLTWGWNLKYGLVCYGIFVAMFVVISV